MQSKLRDLLDKIYELEGLVHLSLKREESSEDFLRLISKKGMEVGDICKEFMKIEDESNIVTPSSPQPEFSSFSFDEYTIEESGATEIYTDETSDSNASSSEITDKPVEKDLQRGKLVFSINERFRFRKELFDNSDADFNNTLALVASMENFEEAEDYFINEEGFNPAEPVVAEFMDVIKRYFK